MSADTGARPGEEIRFVYGGFWIRTAALLIDLLTVGQLIASGAGRLWGRLLPDPAALGPFHLSHLLVAALFWAYLVLATALFGRTLGKHLFGLRVVGLEYGRPDWTTVLFREVVGRILVAATFLVGYLWAAFHPRKQGWHDAIADTFVIRRVPLLTVADPWAEESEAALAAVSSGDERD